MSGSLLEVLTENERQANRSCAIAGLWTAAAVREVQDRFLENLGIRVAKTASEKVLDAAYSAWSRYQKDNPGAEGPGVFEKYFETLTVLEP